MNILFSFDFIYQAQNLKTFLPDACELNFTSIEGVHGYCDDVSANLLRKNCCRSHLMDCISLVPAVIIILACFSLKNLWLPFPCLYLIIIRICSLQYSAIYYLVAAGFSMR